MAKAQFQRNQRVWVESVGCWATIDRVVPIWAKGFDEPVRVTYDVGLGRDFRAEELTAEEGVDASGAAAADGPAWRVLRAKNKWQPDEACAHHPYPGTFPVVVTDSNDWGGWRTPGAEYDRDPHRMEAQARLISQAPRLLALARELLATVGEAPQDAPPELQRLAAQAGAIDRFVRQAPLPVRAGGLAA